MTNANPSYAPKAAAPQNQCPPVNLSISIVTYNSPANELGALLGSLAKSKATCSVMVVDNSPEDRLRSVATAAGAFYRHVPQNVGFGAAHNLALQQQLPNSRYHLICNPDIFCMPGALDELYAFMERNPTVGLVMPQVFYPDGKMQRLCKRLPTPSDLFLRRFVGKRGPRFLQRQRERYELHGLDLSEPRCIPNLSGCFMFLRSSVLQKVGLFDPRYFLYMEDVDLCRRVGVVSQTVFYPHASVVHGYAKGSYHDSRLLRLHLASAVRYFNKWGWFFDPIRRRLNRCTGLWPDSQASDQVMR